MPVRGNRDTQSTCRKQDNLVLLELRVGQALGIVETLILL